MDTAGKRNLLRRILRWVVLAALAALLVAGPAPWPARALAALSPHLAVISAVALRSVGLVAAGSLPMIVLVALRRRWFCRWLCPVGLIAETCGRVSPFRKRRYGRLPAIGQWLALASLGGALVGWPLFLWADPLSLFSSAVGIGRGPATLAGAAAGAGLAGVALLSLVAPNLWCGHLCPLGGTQEILAGLKRLIARRVRREGKAPETGLLLARRSALCAGAGAAFALVAGRLLRGSPRRLRPPGAVEETRFRGLCVRCGNCIRACPSRIIRPELTGEVSAFLAPVVRFPPERPSGNYCLETCHECTRSCPTGAIERLSLDEKNRRPIGLAKIDVAGCLVSADETCAVCIDACPREAISLVFCEETYTNAPQVDAARCNGCGACLLVCPVDVVTVEPR